jgi:putative oxygen-independent coproporphyrinogen III oxidase
LCSYCNFNKYQLPPRVDHEKLKDCLIKEVKFHLQASEYPHVTSVYFGGGTPSLAPVSTIESVLDCIDGTVGLVNGAEVSLEVNPRLQEKMKLKSFLDAGVNRISLGIQSLDDFKLSNVLKRDHSAGNALEVLNEACRIMARNRISIDLMFGLPQQSMDEWVNHISQLSSYNVGHMSLYQLTIEKGTPLAKSIKNGLISLPPQDEITNMYFKAIELLNSKGYRHYEVSSYAQPGSESKHNLNYWLGGNYIGVGPGAHSRYRLPHSMDYSWISYINALTPQQWMSSVLGSDNGMKVIKHLTPKERFEEVLATSLRTSTGLLQIHCEAFNIDYDSLCNQFNAFCPLFFEQDLLRSTPFAITPTTKGISLIDAMLPDLLACIDDNSIH